MDMKWSSIDSHIQYLRTNTKIHEAVVVLWGKLSSAGYQQGSYGYESESSRRPYRRLHPRRYRGSERGLPTVKSRSARVFICLIRVELLRLQTRLRRRSPGLQGYQIKAKSLLFYLSLPFDNEFA